MASGDSNIQQELIKHLNILYGGHSQRDAIQTANKFLMEFNKHPNAWSVCLSILIESTNNNNDENTILILRFSAQTVYDGLLQHWQNTTIQQRKEIIAKLKIFIESFSNKYLFSYLDLNQNSNNNNNDPTFKSSFRFIFNKICQSIAFLALNIKQGIDIIDAIFNACSNIKLPQNLSLLWVNLEILIAFAIEFEQKHVSITIIEEIKNILQDKYQNKILTLIMNTLKSSNYNKNILFRLIEISFLLLKHWINIVDITLENSNKIGLLNEILNIIHLIYKTSNNNNNIQCRQYMIESMNKIIIKGINNKNNMIEYNKILSKITLTYSSLKPFLDTAIKINNKSIIQSLCNLICNFCENEINFIVRGEHNSCLILIDMILNFTSYESTIITTETFGFWLRLQDIPTKQRHEKLKKEIFISLLKSLLLHSKHCDEFDKYSRFRTNSTELFISIYFILNKYYFIQIESQLNSLIERLKINNNNRDRDTLYVGVESCIFALSIISQEMKDEKTNNLIQELLNKHIKPIFNILLNSNLYLNINNDLNSTTFHLLNSICSFFRGYSFYICLNQQLLQKCLQFNIDIPIKYNFKIMIYECSKTFESLLYHSTSIWINKLNDFEKFIKFVIQQIGYGKQFYHKLNENELKLLINSCEGTIDNPIIKQQNGISIYYKSFSMIIDTIPINEQKMKENIVNEIIILPVNKLKNIITNATANNNNNINNKEILYEITANLYIIQGIISGLKTTDIKTHPLIINFGDKNNSILNICNQLIKLQININNCDINILYDSICDIIESILIIFGGTTINVIGNLMQMVLQILKNTKSESSARVIKQMVSIFMSNNNSNNDIEKNFIKLIFDIISHYNNDNEFSIDDIEIFYSTINEIFGAVDVILINNKNNTNNFNIIWNQIVPNCIQLSLKILTKLQDRNALKCALNILTKIFDIKYCNSLGKILNELKNENVLSNIINILFNGISIHFERMIANKTYDIYYSLLQLDCEYVKQQTIKLLNETKINAFNDNNNKELFMKAFWIQRLNKRKFNLVMSTFFSVCHNFNTPDTFGSMIE